MNNKDIIQRFIIENAGVRGEIVRLNTSYQTIIKQHQYPQAISHVLGELLASSCLLSAIIKFKGRLTIQFQGKHPLKLLLAQCTEQFAIRGLAQWHGELNQADLLKLMQEGLLAIIISPDASVNGYQGIVAWQGGSLAQSIEGYFKNSEQLPTRLWLAVNDDSVVGFMLQPLPADGSQKIKPVAVDKDWEHVIQLAQTITEAELLTLDNETILHRLFSEEDVRLFSSEPIEFRCTCSVERSESAILLLGQQEAEQELADKQKIVVTCEFCSREYSFDRIDVTAIFKKGGNASQMH